MKYAVWIMMGILGVFLIHPLSAQAFLTKEKVTSKVLFESYQLPIVSVLPKHQPDLYFAYLDHNGNLLRVNATGDGFQAFIDLSVYENVYQDNSLSKQTTDSVRYYLHTKSYKIPDSLANNLMGLIDEIDVRRIKERNNYYKKNYVSNRRRSACRHAFLLSSNNSIPDSIYLSCVNHPDFQVAYSSVLRLDSLLKDFIKTNDLDDIFYSLLPKGRYYNICNGNTSYGFYTEAPRIIPDVLEKYGLKHKVTRDYSDEVSGNLSKNLNEVFNSLSDTEREALVRSCFRYAYVLFDTDGTFVKVLDELNNTALQTAEYMRCKGELERFLLKLKKKEEFSHPAIRRLIIWSDRVIVEDSLFYNYKER